jgi:hypothetical protein
VRKEMVNYESNPRNPGPKEFIGDENAIHSYHEDHASS